MARFTNSQFTRPSDHTALCSTTVGDPHHRVDYAFSTLAQLLAPLTCSLLDGPSSFVRRQVMSRAMTQSYDPVTAVAEPDASVKRPAPRMFLNDIPFWFEVSEDGTNMVGGTTINDVLRFPGSGLPRTSVLATIADCVAGLPACIITAPRLGVTLDIVVHNVAERCGDHLEIGGELVKVGRSIVSGEVRFSDPESNALVAVSYLTFMVSPRPQDVLPPIQRGMRTTGSITTPFPEFLGVRTLAPGVTEIDLVPLVMQASQALQGGVFGVLAEEAARSLADRPVLDLDIRYLNAVRVGPGRAIATLLGENLIRVEVRDRGNDDRLASLVLIRTA